MQRAAKAATLRHPVDVAGMSGKGHGPTPEKQNES